MSHVVLLGDSIFDNGAYVGGGPDVCSQLASLLPNGWQSTLLAIDGSVMASIAEQLSRMPPAATHIVVSIGGNDALGHSNILEAGAHSVAEALSKIATVRHDFCRQYSSMIDSVLQRKLPTAVCTIYDPRFEDEFSRTAATIALTALNDCITREAFSRDVTVIDLRLICNDDADFANAIEPSVQGGAKIAQAVARFVTSGTPNAGVIAH
jgi:GDSL-like Lipase/Acylhydrolase family